MGKTPETVKALRKLVADKKKYGVYPCCARVRTGPHSQECPVEHPGPYYS